MMAVWSEDEEVVCVHPGSIRLIGLSAIRESWRQLFESGTRSSSGRAGRCSGST
jgi:hypothetical protein